MATVTPSKTASSSVAPRVVKVSFNIPEDELNELRALAEARGITVTHAIRQAIATEILLSKEIANGGRVIIEYSDGSQKELIFRS